MDRRADDVDRAVAHLRDVLETRLAGMDAARALQFAEFMRRLEELNHAHQRAVDDRAAFLPRELYETSERELRHWRDMIAADVIKAKADAEYLASDAKAKATQQAAVYAVVSSFVSSLAMLVLGHYWR